MSNDFREPPHNDDAERAVLGALMVDDAKIDLARDRLSPTDFYRETHRHIYRAMLGCHDDGQALDVVTVCDKLVEHGTFETVGEQSVVARLLSETPSAANIESHIAIVERNAYYRDAAGTLSAYLDQAYDPSEDFADFAAEVSHAVEGIVDEGSDDKLKWADEVAADCVEQAEVWVEEDAEAGLSTGLSAIDHKFKLEPSRLYIVAGRPSMGKSALAQRMQGSLSIDRGLATAIFSMEMSDTQVGFRHICQQAKIDQEKIRRGRLGEDGWRSLLRGTVDFKESPIAIDSTERLSLPGLRAKTRRLVSQHDVRCIFVDYLQMMRAPPDLNTRNEKVGALAYGLKYIAKECEIPVVVLSQLNRGVESRENKRPNISDLRASGKIEEAADVIAMLYRENYYDEDADDDGIAELLVRKNRSGEIGKAELYWEARHTLFRDLDRRHRPQRRGFD